MMSIIVRLAVSVALFLAYGWINNLFNSASTLATGKIAGLQFDASDSSYVVSQFGMNFFGHIGVPFVVLLALIVWLWWKPVKSILAAAAIASCALIIAPVPQSQAYYDKSDYAEPYFILPNESAFWVPDVGDNKTSQTKFGSAEYYEASKIAAKRYIIPHTKLEGSGLFSNFYVPAGRLVIVNRAPVSLEWVRAAQRGSSAKDDSFPCQSKEGLNINVGMAIGVSVMEENAAKYLYRFGVEPLKGNRDDPNVIFQSVLHSRSLFDVMSKVGRNKVQALVCNEITTRTFDDANSQAIQVMTNVKDLATKYFESVGITLDYLGWADTMEFDPEVQKAVNDRYTNEKLRPILDVMKTTAAIDALRKWNGQLPSTVSGMWLIPSDLWNAITGWFSSPAQAATKK